MEPLVDATAEAAKTVATLFDRVSDVFEAFVHIAAEYTLLDSPTGRAKIESDAIDAFCGNYGLLYFITRDATPSLTAVSSKVHQLRAWIRMERSVGYYNSFVRWKDQETPSIMEWLPFMNNPAFKDMSAENAAQFCSDVLQEQSSVFDRLAAGVSKSTSDEERYEKIQFYDAFVPYMIKCLESLLVVFKELRKSHSTGGAGDRERVSRIISELLTESAESRFYVYMTNRTADAERICKTALAILADPVKLQSIWADEVLRPYIATKLGLDERIHGMLMQTSRVWNSVVNGTAETANADAAIRRINAQECARVYYAISGTPVDSEEIELALSGSGKGMELLVRTDEVITAEEKLLPFVPQHRYYRRCERQRKCDSIYGTSSARAAAAEADTRTYARPLAAATEDANDAFLRFYAVQRADNIELIKQAREFALQYRLPAVPLVWNQEELSAATGQSIGPQPVWHKQYVDRLYYRLLTSPEYIARSMLVQKDFVAAKYVCDTKRFLTDENALERMGISLDIPNQAEIDRQTRLVKSKLGIDMDKSPKKTPTQPPRTPKGTPPSTPKKGRNFSSLAPNRIDFAPTASGYERREPDYDTARDPTISWSEFRDKMKIGKVLAKLPTLTASESCTPMQQFEYIYPVRRQPLSGSNGFLQSGVQTFDNSTLYAKEFRVGERVSYIVAGSLDLVRSLAWFALGAFADAAPTGAFEGEVWEDPRFAIYRVDTGNGVYVYSEQSIQLAAVVGQAFGAPKPQISARDLTTVIDYLGVHAGPQLAFWVSYTLYHFLMYLGTVGKIGDETRNLPQIRRNMRLTTPTLATLMLKYVHTMYLDPDWYIRKQAKENALVNPPTIAPPSLVLDAFKPLAGRSIKGGVAYLVACGINASVFGAAGVIGRGWEWFVRTIRKTVEFERYDDPVLMDTTLFTLSGYNMIKNVVNWARVAWNEATGRGWIGGSAASADDTPRVNEQPSKQAVKEDTAQKPAAAPKDTKQQQEPPTANTTDRNDAPTGTSESSSGSACRRIPETARTALQNLDPNLQKKALELAESYYALACKQYSDMNITPTVFQIDANSLVQKAMKEANITPNKGIGDVLYEFFQKVSGDLNVSVIPTYQQDMDLLRKYMPSQSSSTTDDQAQAPSSASNNQTRDVTQRPTPAELAALNRITNNLQYLEEQNNSQTQKAPQSSSETNVISTDVIVGAVRALLWEINDSTGALKFDPLYLEQNIESFVQNDINKAVLRYMDDVTPYSLLVDPAYLRRFKNIGHRVGEIGLHVTTERGIQQAMNALPDAASKIRVNFVGNNPWWVFVEMLIVMLIPIMLSKLPWKQRGLMYMIAPMAYFLIWLGSHF